MASYDSITAGSFSAEGAGAPISAEHGQRIVCNVAGTFSATVVLERSSSLHAWDRVHAFTTPGRFETPDIGGGYYRLRCTAQTSGTATYELRAFDATQLQEDHWDDFRFPAAGINPPGAAADPTRDTEDGCFLFSAVSTNVIAIQALMPHGWKTGSLVVPHVHWTKTTGAAGDVVWEFKYKIAEAGQPFPAEWATFTASTPVSGTPDDDSADRHLITSFGRINLGVGDVAPMLKILVSRLPGDEADTYGSAAKLLEFDIHYLKDSIGSGGEFTK